MSDRIICCTCEESVLIADPIASAWDWIEPIGKCYHNAERIKCDCFADVGFTGRCPECRNRDEHNPFMAGIVWQKGLRL